MENYTRIFYELIHTSQITYIFTGRDKTFLIYVFCREEVDFLTILDEINPFSRDIIGISKKLFLLFLLLFCLVRTQKIVWFRKKVSDGNFIIRCNYATLSEKGSKNDKKLKLVVVYS